MWDPAHRNPLDRPAYKTDNAQQQPSQNYWIDSRGVRHSLNATPPPRARRSGDEISGQSSQR